MPEEKWYHSDFAAYLGGGLAIAAIIVGLGYGCGGCQQGCAALIHGNSEASIERRAEIDILSADLNHNGIEDKL